MLSSMWSDLSRERGQPPGQRPRDPPARRTGVRALVAEPLFLLADSAIVGHLGTAQLAGARRRRRGPRHGRRPVRLPGLRHDRGGGPTARRRRPRGALAHRHRRAVARPGPGRCARRVRHAGPGRRPGRSGSGRTAPSTTHAVTYLRSARCRLPGDAGRPGLDRRAARPAGHPDAARRRPSGAAANVVLNLALVYGAGLGIAGSALGTALAQLGMAVALTTWSIRGARRDGASLRAPSGPASSAPRAPASRCCVRTLSLRAVLLVTTWRRGQPGRGFAWRRTRWSSTIWTPLAFALDALAIAGAGARRTRSRAPATSPAPGPRLGGCCWRRRRWRGLGLVTRRRCAWCCVPLFTDRPGGCRRRCRRPGRGGRRASPGRLGVRAGRRADRRRRRALPGREPARHARGVRAAWLWLVRAGPWPRPRSGGRSRAWMVLARCSPWACGPRRGAGWSSAPTRLTRVAPPQTWVAPHSPAVSPVRLVRRPFWAAQHQPKWSKPAAGGSKQGYDGSGQPATTSSVTIGLDALGAAGRSPGGRRGS